MTAAAVGTDGLHLAWAASTSASIGGYRVSYAPGVYVPGPAGGTQSLDLPADAASADLTGLRAFTQYTVDVSALDAAGATLARSRVVAWTARPAGLRRYLYAFDLPKNRTGFATLKPQVQVYDVDAGHQLVRSIPLPAGIYNVRGVAADAATNRLYVAFFNTAADAYQTGGLLAMDLTSGAVLWLKRYPAATLPSVDRFALTPDGAKIYMPTGEDGPTDYWAVIDAATGDVTGKIHHTTAPHNTVAGVSGRYVYLEGQEKSPDTQPPSILHTLAVVDTATDTVVQRIGPFKNVIRPFTVDGSDTLVYATIDNFVGVQIGDVRTGKVLYTLSPPNYVQPDPPFKLAISHGVALTPDEREVWVADSNKVGFHVWDVAGVAAGVAPTYVGFVATRKPGKNLAGAADPLASNDPAGQPSWIATSYDGRYMYAESGEVIDVASHAVVGQLKGPTGLYEHSRYFVEVDVDAGGTPVDATQQFGTGHVR